LIKASDISKEALEVAMENAKSNSAEIDFIHSDLFSNIKDKFDVIISNPPYISYDEEIMDVVKNNEPHLALYSDNNGLSHYEKILKDISNYLNDKFLISFEIGSTQASKLINLAHLNLQNIYVWVEKDMSNRDRFLFITNISM